MADPSFVDINLRKTIVPQPIYCQPMSAIVIQGLIADSIFSLRVRSRVSPEL